MIVEFDVDCVLLRRSLSAAPGMRVRVEHLDASAVLPLRSMFWARDGAFDAFEQALDEDPGVEDWSRLATAGGAGFYAAHHSEDADFVAVYRAAVDLDAVVLAATSKDDRTGFHVRMRFPDRTAFGAFRDRLAEVGLTATIRAIYDASEEDPGERFGLTAAQRETLLAAVRLGYFSIPRETPLAGVADELGISPQATSERLRRGMESLVRGALDVPKEA
jgi:hypothetical protein